MSQDLLDRLADDLRPVRRSAVAGRLGLGFGGGAAVSVAFSALVLGLRPDLDAAVGGATFWIKLAYVLAVGGTALWACERLARPGGEAGRRLPWLLAPVAAVVLLAAWRLVRASPAARMPMLMGGSASVCPWLIVLVALPSLAGLVWAVRTLAPTRLRLTGLVVGLAAGGVGAAAYSLHCPETGVPFLAVWYSLGVLMTAALGGLLGPRLLRW